MRRRPPRSTRTDTLFPTRRSSDLGRLRRPRRAAPAAPDLRASPCGVALAVGAWRRRARARRRQPVPPRARPRRGSARGRDGADRRALLPRAAAPATEVGMDLTVDRLGVTLAARPEIGRASCRERELQYV